MTQSEGACSCAAWPKHRHRAAGDRRDAHLPSQVVLLLQRLRHQPGSGRGPCTAVHARQAVKVLAEGLDIIWPELEAAQLQGSACEL